MKVLWLRLVGILGLALCAGLMGLRSHLRPTSQRAGLAALAFVVGAAGVTLLVRAFRRR